MIDKTLFTYSIGTVRPLAKVFHFADQLVAKTLRNHGEPEHVRTWLKKKIVYKKSLNISIEQKTNANMPTIVTFRLVSRFWL